jgi:hypothetical protein
MLSVATTGCVGTPDLRLATALQYDPKNDSSVSAKFDASAPCFEPSPGAKSLYRLYWLPTADAPYIISIASALNGGVVFAPHIVLLDSHGAPAREISRDAITFRNGNLSALFRSHRDERYLLIASDPAEVGQHAQRIVEGRNTSTAGAGGLYFNIYTGTDTETDFVYAHNGTVTVTLSPIPTIR